MHIIMVSDKAVKNKCVLILARKNWKRDTEYERTIIPSDMNVFMLSVEMMLNPELQGKAVAVCGSTENRHGIVLGKNQRKRNKQE